MPSLLAFKPADTPDYMIQAWIDCLLWAIGEEGIVQTFREETGNTYQPSRNGLERMIDEATGADRAFAEAFIQWANVRVWGPIDGPVPE